MRSCLSPVSQFFHRLRNRQDIDAQAAPAAAPSVPPIPLCADPPCNVTIRYSTGKRKHGITRKAPSSAANTMHLAQHAPGFVGLGNGLRRDAMHFGAPSTPPEVVTRTVAVPSGLGSDDTEGFRVDKLILAWALLLQRDRGDDNPVEQFTWGVRSLGGTETISRFSLPAVGLALSRTSSEPVSAFLETARRSVESIESSQPEAAFFYDEPPALTSPRKGESDTESTVGLADQCTVEGIS